MGARDTPMKHGPMGNAMVRPSNRSLQRAT